MLRGLAVALLHERAHQDDRDARQGGPPAGREDHHVGQEGRRAFAPPGAWPSSATRSSSHKVFADIAPRFEEREGGYTRIMKLGPRKGDAAPMVIMELVD